MEEEKIKMLQSFFKERHITQKMICERTGMSQPQVSQLLTGKNKFGNKVAKQFEKEFGLSYIWLIHGEGDMMGGAALKAGGVPVYDIYFNAGFVERYNDSRIERVGTLDSPKYNKATAVVSVTGDSMHPLISNGDEIIIRQMPVSIDSLMNGHIYAIVTDNDLHTVKRVRKSAQVGCIDLEPINKEVADTTTIALSRIVSLWLVMGCIKPIN
jgi:SOS-response transcriptional repressor LexA